MNEAGTSIGIESTFLRSLTQGSAGFITFEYLQTARQKDIAQMQRLKYVGGI